MHAVSSIAINPARVDFVTLRLFCAVAETGSITKGASRCNLALSAASRRLADFEAATGLLLFERTTQGIRLTAAGAVALQHALRLCHGFELFGAELAEHSEGYRGQVRLWANMSALSEGLPDALAQFMARQPEIKTDIEEQLSGDIVRALLDGVADIGVFAEGVSSTGITVREFLTQELVAVCVRGHPLTEHAATDFRTCLTHPFVGLNRGSSLLDLTVNAAQEVGLPLRLRVQVRSFGAMCRMVAADLGIGILPLAACQALLEPYGLQAVRLTDHWAQRRLVVGCSTDRPLAPAAALLWEHLSTGCRSINGDAKG
jgi:DNA-binding transcriptional LysR family regulator